MNRETKLDSFPNDLITEIHSRLPAKSIARFRCVSKLWGSMLSRPCFAELFLTKSWARPHILFGIQEDDGLSFYSSPQSQNPYDNSSVVAGFHMKISRDMKPHFGSVTSGLIYFSSIKISSKETAPVICNPRTGKYAILPKQTRYDENSCSFLGFDPIDKQFKVLFNAYPDEMDHVEILTVGSGKMCWRKIKCGLTHNPSFCKGICISGVLYYFAPRLDKRDFDDENYRDRKLSNMIVCFDVRSEKFKFINIESYYGQLINYKGKLGAVNFGYAGNTIRICMWILEDMEKQVWSKYVYSLEEDAVITPYNHSIAGVTTTGEIVFFTAKSSKPYYVFYFNPERNTLRKVEIQGLEKYCNVIADVNLIEDLYVDDAKQLKSNQGLNIIRKRPKAYCHTCSCDLSNSVPSVKNKQPTKQVQFIG